MGGIQWFTVILQTIIGLFAGPILILIGFGKIFGKTPPAWAVWGMIVLLAAYFALWLRGVIRTARSIRAMRAEQTARG